MCRAARTKRVGALSGHLLMLYLVEESALQVQMFADTICSINCSQHVHKLHNMYVLGRVWCVAHANLLHRCLLQMSATFTSHQGLSCVGISSVSNFELQLLQLSVFIFVLCFRKPSHVQCASLQTEQRYLDTQDCTVWLQSTC